MIFLALAVLAALYVVTAYAVAVRPTETTAAALLFAGAVLVAMAAAQAGAGEGDVTALLTVAGIAAGALAPVVAMGGTSALKPAGGAR